MKPGHEFDLVIAKEVMGHAIHLQGDQAVEVTPQGARHLAHYSSQIEAAFEVANKLGVTLIPITGGQWFAFIGPNVGWKDPGEFIKFLSTADFNQSGAAVAESPAFTICVAAWNAVRQRQLMSAQQNINVDPAQNVVNITH